MLRRLLPARRFCHSLASLIFSSSQADVKFGVSKLLHFVEDWAEALRSRSLLRRALSFKHCSVAVASWEGLRSQPHGRPRRGGAGLPSDLPGSEGSVFVSFSVWGCDTEQKGSGSTRLGKRPATAAPRSFKM